MYLWYRTWVPNCCIVAPEASKCVSGQIHQAYLAKLSDRIPWSVGPFIYSQMSYFTHVKSHHLYGIVFCSIKDAIIDIRLISWCQLCESFVALYMLCLRTHHLCSKTLILGHLCCKTMLGIVMFRNLDNPL